jgi:hypothetical protein
MYDCRYLTRHHGDRHLADTAFELAFPKETAQGYEAILAKIRALRAERGLSRPRKKKRTAVVNNTN